MSSDHNTRRPINSIDAKSKSKAELNSLAASINEKIVSRKAHLQHLRNQLSQLQEQCVENWGTDDLQKLRKIYSESVAAQNAEMNAFYQALNEASLVLNQIDTELDSLGSSNAR